MEAFLKEHGSNPDVGLYKFKFGKYKGHTYQEVYNTDKPYTAFLFQKLDKNKNQILLDYIKERVEEEYSPK
jgi:hypothetical protein